MFIASKLVFLHYNREDLFIDHTGKTIEERLKEFETLENCEVVRLKDEEYICVEYIFPTNACNMID